jgi:hypothetical protein
VDRSAPPRPGRFGLRIDPDRALPGLLGLTVLIGAVSLAALLVHSGLHLKLPGSTFVLNLTSPTQRGSLPAWAAAGLLLAAALSCWTVADDARTAGAGRVGWWRGLALICGYLSLDAVAAVHEQAVDQVQEALHLTGFLASSWVVLVTPLVVLLAVAHLPFLASLPPATRRGLLGSALLFAAGALGVEAWRQVLELSSGPDTLIHAVVSVLEKSLEMFGAVALLVTLGRHGGTPADVPAAPPERRPIVEGPAALAQDARITGYLPTAPRPNDQPVHGQPVNGQPVNGQPVNGQPAPADATAAWLMPTRGAQPGPAAAEPPGAERVHGAASGSAAWPLGPQPDAPAGQPPPGRNGSWRPTRRRPAPPPEDPPPPLWPTR